MRNHSLSRPFRYWPKEKKAEVHNAVADALIQRYGARHWWAFSERGAMAAEFFQMNPELRDDSPEARSAAAALDSSRPSLVSTLPTHDEHEGN